MIFADILLSSVAQLIGYIVMIGITMFIVVSFLKTTWKSFKGGGDEE
jgi:hypothetical protein